VNAPLVIAIANAGIMAVVALMGGRTPRWLRPASWLLLIVALAVLALHLVAPAWGIDANALAIAFLISTCLNAGALAPLVMQGLLARTPRARRTVE
jgi:uncharacterized membrane protein YgdD (TMEM256/DUF423 family)